MTIEQEEIKMNKKYLLIISVFFTMLASCSLTPIPKPTKNTAIIELKPQVTQVLMAETLDRKSVNDGRYFQVTPGNHRLTILFQYAASAVSGLFINNNSTISCVITFYSHFVADTTYYVQAIPTTTGAELFINKTNETNNTPIPNVNVSCGAY